MKSEASERGSEFLHQVWEFAREWKSPPHQSRPWLTQHYFGRVLAIAAAWIGALEPEVPPLPDEEVDSLHDACDSHLSARRKEALAGSVPVLLPVAKLGLFERYKFDRLRDNCVLMEPVEPLDPVMSFQGDWPDHTPLRAEPTFEAFRRVMRQSRVGYLLGLRTLDALAQDAAVRLLGDAEAEAPAGTALALLSAAAMLGEERIAARVLERLPEEYPPSRWRETAVSGLISLGMHTSAEEFLARLDPTRTACEQLDLQLARQLLGGPAPQLEEYVRAFGPQMHPFDRIRLFRGIARASAIGRETYDVLNLLLAELRREPAWDAFNTRTHYSVAAIAFIDSLGCATVEASTAHRLDRPGGW